MKLIIFLVLGLGFYCHGKPQVWYTSNSGTPDLLDMFTQPDSWKRARANIDVFKFYQGHYIAESKKECTWCEENWFGNLLARNAFNFLKDSNIALGAEVGGVKPGDCDAVLGTNNTVRLINLGREYGFNPQYIGIDNGFYAGFFDCKQSVDLTARYTARYIHTIKETHKELLPDEEPMQVGLLENYPSRSIDEAIRMVQALIAYDSKPDFYHIDLDYWALKGKNITPTKLGNDLRKFKRFLDSYEIPMGVVFFGHDGKNQSNYRKNLVKWMADLKKAFGAPEHIQFQNWDGYVENGIEYRRIPQNLPEGLNVSHTGILLEGLKIFGRLK